MIDYYKITENKPSHSSLSGDGKKALCIIIQAEDASAGNIKMLGDICKAIRYDLHTDAYMCLINASSCHLIDLLPEAVITDYLSFGFTPVQLTCNFHVPHYQEITLSGQRFLLADSLGEIQKDKTKKMALWNALQRMFINKK